MNEKHASCANCKFYKANEGLCRRFPPSPVLVALYPESLRIQSHFPPMQPVGWCGEWRQMLH